MTRIDLETLLVLLEQDQEHLQALVEHGIISEDTQSFAPDDVETILVSHTLVRELEVNWPGVDVILRMRRQLLMARLQLAELARKR